MEHQFALERENIYISTFISILTCLLYAKQNARCFTDVILLMLISHISHERELQIFIPIS